MTHEVSLLLKVTSVIEIGKIKRTIIFVIFR